MTTLVLLFTLLAGPPEAGPLALNEVLAGAGQTPVPTAAPSQEIDVPDGTRIASAQVSGLSVERLSPGLRQDITALAGTPLARERLAALAARIESELPDVVAAIRTAADGDEVRVIFLVARINGDRHLENNINARYLVERVEIRGVPESRVSQALRDEVQALTGKPLDNDEAERLDKRLTEELPGYEVRRHISRGTERGRIDLVFDISRTEAARFVQFAPTTSKFLVHSDQGWSGLLDIPMGGRDHRVTANLAFDNADDLVEEYSGAGVRIESRKAAGGRLGLGLDLSYFHPSWDDATLVAVAANPLIPAVYDRRSTVAPSATFGFTPHFRVSGGVSITELSPLTEGLESGSANSFVLSAGFDREWKQSDEPGGRRNSDQAQAFDAGFSLRAGADSLESDLVYKRYFGHASYRFSWGDNEVLASGLAGRITGRAPLFERFTLGDSTTLRGWNKYDIAPAGGDQVLHSSVEFRSHGLALFLDSGSIWDRGQNARARVSTGFGLHLDNVFLTLGFPLNTDDVRAVFAAGIRF